MQKTGIRLPSNIENGGHAVFEGRVGSWDGLISYNTYNVDQRLHCCERSGRATKVVVTALVEIHQLDHPRIPKVRKT